ncbi:MAG: carboxypeptidase-like regulatory domain-containing protein, partial [Saprospiraceae bacterium]|nr:carboxypeptidase-like regulatory domain-containing protein [Saprospiraceae bacterium]
MNRSVYILLFILGYHSLVGQIDDLDYSGQLFDAYSHTPIEGATVTLSNKSNAYEAITNSKGLFSFRKLSSGNYQLIFQSLGYQTKSVAEIEINTGVPRNKVFLLDPSQESLDEVVVKAESRERSAEAVNSIYTLTVEESFRFPGTFYDPARLATHYAGVINENDQANNIVIRGNTPNGLGWYLEGVEIVNPNHLSNAGTINDRSSESGGGVNILSAQMLDNSTFLTGAFPAYYGNATSGILDMRLREGARDRIHFTGQIGLLGIDAALEGPIRKKQENSFLINYRYSTIGLLSAMGVDLGDEAITFQDLSFHLKWKLKNKGSVSFFGMGGVSQNKFKAPQLSERTDFKDEQNIDFTGRMAATGLKFENSRWEHTLAYSGYHHQRNSELTNIFFQFEPFETDETTEQRIGIHSRRKILLKEGGQAQIGIRAN